MWVKRFTACLLLPVSGCPRPFTSALWSSSCRTSKCYVKGRARCVKLRNQDCHLWAQLLTFPELSLWMECSRPVLPACFALWPSITNGSGSQNWSGTTWRPEQWTTYLDTWFPQGFPALSSLAVNSLLGRLLLALVVSGTLQGRQAWSTRPELLGVGGSLLEEK